MRKTKKTLAVLAIVAMVLTMLPLQVFAADTSSRISDADRVGTAVKIAQAGWTTATAAIVVPANDENMVDALAAASLAGQINAPILVTDKAALDTRVSAEIAALGATKVYAIGALSDAAITSLKAVSGVTVEQLKGADRIATAALVAGKLTDIKGAFVVGYNATPDALSAASFAAANGYAILITDLDGSLPASEAAYKLGTVYVLGGPTLVDDIAGATRLFGADRYATNDKILSTLTYKYTKVYVANGETLVDALAGSALAAQTNSPIVLANATSAFAAANVNKKLNAASKVIALGGTGVVPNSVLGLVAYATPDTLAVASVSVVDASTINVVFNNTVDEGTAEDVDNYSFEGIETDDLTVEEAALQSDGITVKLTLDVDADVLTNEDEDYKVIIENIEDENGDEMDAYKEVLTLSDTVRPTVVSAKLIDNDMMQIKFSELITGADWATGVLVIDDAADLADFVVDYAADDHTVVNVTGLYANLDDQDSVNLVLAIYNGLEDLAGNKISPNPYFKGFAIETDSTKPTVKSVTSLSKSAFKVVFSEPIYAADPDNLDPFTLEVAGDLLDQGVDYTVTEVDDSNMTEFTVELDGEQSGLTKISINDFTDNADNDQTKAYVKYIKFAENGPALESTKATIKTIEGEKYAVLTFDQAIDTLNAEDLSGSYVDDDDSVIEVDNLELTGLLAGRLVTVDTLDSLEDTQLAIALTAVDIDADDVDDFDALVAGDYTVTLPDALVEAYGAGNDETDVTFTVSDSVASDVAVDSISTDVNNVYVTYTDEVGNSALTLKNYTVEGDNTAFTKAVFTSSTKTEVKLTLKTSYIALTGEYLFEVNNVLDADGNEVDEYSEYEFFAETTKPYLYKAVVSNTDTVEIDFNENLANYAVDVTVDDFVVTVNGTEVDLDDVTSDDGKHFIITLSNDITDLDAVVKVKTSDDFDGEDDDGNVGVIGSIVTAKWL